MTDENDVATSFGQTIWSAREYRAIRDNRAASDWLKDALESALDRDPVDAVSDAEALLAVLADKLRALREYHAPR